MFLFTTTNTLARFAITLLTVLLLTACGDQKTSPDPASAPTFTQQMTVWLSNSASAPSEGVHIAFSAEESLLYRLLNQSPKKIEPVDYRQKDGWNKLGEYNIKCQSSEISWTLSTGYRQDGPVTTLFAVCPNSGKRIDISLGKSIGFTFILKGKGERLYLHISGNDLRQGREYDSLLEVSPDGQLSEVTDTDPADLEKIYSPGPTTSGRDAYYLGTAEDLLIESPIPGMWWTIQAPEEKEPLNVFLMELVAYSNGPFFHFHGTMGQGAPHHMWWYNPFNNELAYERSNSTFKPDGHLLGKGKCLTMDWNKPNMTLSNDEGGMSVYCGYTNHRDPVITVTNPSNS